MIIEELKVKNFGRLHEKTITLTPGMNVLYGENESGKSTLYHFIRSMFFGVPRLRGKAARTDLYNRYEPWENPTYYAGSMKFRCGDKKFLLERNFYKETESASLVCLTDGELLSVEDGDLKMLLGEINESIYDNTVSVGQLKSVTGKELAQEVQSYMANYQGGGDGEIDPTMALQLLAKQRRSLQSEKGQEQEGRMRVLRKLEANTELLETQQKECQERLQIAREQQKELEQKVKLHEQKQNSPEIPRQLNKVSGITQEGSNISLKTARMTSIWKKTVGISFVVSMLSLLFAIAFSERKIFPVFMTITVISGIIVMLGVIAGIFFYLRSEDLEELPWDKDIKAPGRIPAAAEPDGASELEACRSEAEKNRWRIQQFHEEYKERIVQLENLQQEIEECKEQEYEKTVLDDEIEAISIAIETLEKTTEGMQSKIGSRLQRRTGEILGELTDGKYTNIVLDSSLQMQVQSLNRLVSLHQLSRGTIEQVYFALRMAAGEVLCAQEPMPVILDDVFPMYDEGRLLKTLQWLQGHKEQVLVFTCHRREEELLCIEKQSKI